MRSSGQVLRSKILPRLRPHRGRCGRAGLDLGRALQEFCRTGPMFVGDMSRDGSPRSPKDRDIVRVAETENDVRDQVRRHHEIGEGAQDDGFYMDWSIAIARAAIGCNRFFGEGNHPSGEA